MDGDWDSQGMAGGMESVAKVPPLPVPSQVTVFGIMHLVLAVFGVLMVAISGVMQEFSRGMLAAQAGAPGMAGAQARLQEEILALSKAPNAVYSVGTILLAVLLAVSGVLLLKRRAAGVRVSNAYAWLSIALKLTALVLFFVWTLPKLEPVLAQVAKEGGTEAVLFGNIMRISMVAGGVLSPVMMCVYPVLALVLLNRSQVKKALAVGRT
jgi:hypothetical protein